MSTPPITSPHTPSMQLAQPGSILVAGSDARSFLQGQLTADLDTLDPQRVLLAACNSAQGRVQAILWLVERSDGIALVLPDTMIETIIVRLRKYVLRSKVKIEHGPSVALIDRATLPAGVAPEGDRVHREHSASSYISSSAHERVLVINASSAASAQDTAQAQWHLEAIRAGLPQVYPQTHEAFVAQMLNLDLLGGISFEKGCYTGQEIIARMHYRGSVKRRMFRYTAACPPPPPGARVVIGDQHAGDVVDAAATSAGCELLAVMNLTQANERLTLDGLPDIAIEIETLPYALGDTTA